jgi:hypothetical protein
MERVKKLEWAKHDPLALPDQVYVLISTHKGVEKTFYVGIAIKPNVRWGQHQRVARMGVNPLPEYEHMRFVGVENCRMEVVDPGGEFTEAEWKQILTDQGHTLLNVAGCVDVKRKKRERYKHQLALEGLTPPKRTLEEMEAHWKQIMETSRNSRSQTMT